MEKYKEKMGLIDFLKKRVGQDEDFREAQRQRRITQVLGEREKSSNERVVEKMMEEERQKRVTEQMKKMQKQRNDELFSGGMQPSKNIFANHKNILDEDKKVIQGQSDTLERGNMFFK